MGSKEKKQDLERELDATAVRWKSFSAEGDMDAAQAQKERIWLLVFELYDQDKPSQKSNGSDQWDEQNARECDPNVILDVLCEVFDRFTPEKGTFSHYFMHLLSRRKVDSYRKTNKHAPFNVSLDRPVSEEEASMCMGDSISADVDSAHGEMYLAPEKKAELDAGVCELISAMLELPRRLHGRANNPVRHNYFRMFFAETVVRCVHGANALEPFRRRERDTFQAMKLEFLDFFMAELCRTVDGIADSRLKPYGALVEGRGPEETRLPLPGEVYVSYLGRMEHTKVGQPAVSQQKTAYKKALKEWLS